MRDIHDYRIQARDGKPSSGPFSPFNIITKTLTLDNFTQEQIAALYQQHTDVTGQIFEPDAVARAYYWSEGQPWLVNALARQAVEKDLALDYSKAVTAAHIDNAAEAIMKRRDTHIDSLLERLKEPRVQRVIEPMLIGAVNKVPLQADDTILCLDLGLVKADSSGALRPSNPIYADVMVRTLNYDTQVYLQQTVANKWADGKNLDMNGLLKEFQKFWRMNSVSATVDYQYKEAMPHLVLQAFLQRVINGNGKIVREYAIGTGRVDVCAEYAGKCYPLEVKLKGAHQSHKEIMEQMESYVEVCGADAGWLLFFDRRSNKSWKDKITWKTTKLPNGKPVYIVGC
jgi:hypothetical protein